MYAVVVRFCLPQHEGSLQAQEFSPVCFGSESLTLLLEHEGSLRSLQAQEFSIACCGYESLATPTRGITEKYLGSGVLHCMLCPTRGAGPPSTKAALRILRTDFASFSKFGCSLVIKRFQGSCDADDRFALQRTASKRAAPLLRNKSNSQSKTPCAVGEDSHIRRFYCDFHYDSHEWSCSEQCKSASHKCVWRVSGHEIVPKPEKPGPVGHNFVSGQTSGRRSKSSHTRGQTQSQSYLPDAIAEDPQIRHF